MKRLGFCITEESQELEATAIEKYYLIAHEVETIWAFDQLVEEVQKACNRTELAFLSDE
jgi:hypothetical protein